LVSSFVVSFPEERREARCDPFFALVARLTAQKLRLQVAAEGEGEPAWSRDQGFHPDIPGFQAA
jgi:hypothetical protein